MEQGKIYLIFAISFLMLVFHSFPLFFTDCFGFDFFRYFSPLVYLIVFLGCAIFLYPGFGFFSILIEKLSEFLNRAYGFVIIVLLFGLCFYLFRVSTPLLGDGLDRIFALGSGLKASLKGQVSPLDILIHYVFYYILKNFLHSANFLSYQLVSYSGGVLFIIALFFLSRRIFSSHLSRFFFNFSLLLSGFSLLFFGYPENYSLLPFAYLIWIYFLWQRLKGEGFLRLLLWQIFLLSLHFFSALFIPATGYALFFTGAHPKRSIKLSFIVLNLIFFGLMFYLVEKYYRGITSIFIKPKDWFSGSHILDFINYQILCVPILPFLLLFGLKNSSSLPKEEKKFNFSLALISICFLIFFFFLRPVIGPAFDWDLFSLSAMVYLPWFLFRTERINSSKKFFPYLVWASFLLTVFHTVPWVLVNHNHQRSISRYSFHLTELSKRNRWAGSYGWLKLGKYYRWQGEIEKAFDAYRIAIEINPKYSVLYEEISREFLKLGRLKDSFVYLEEAHRLNPTNPRIKEELKVVCFSYASYLVNSGKKEEAIEVLKKLLLVEPEFEPAKDFLKQLQN